MTASTLFTLPGCMATIPERSTTPCAMHCSTAASHCQNPRLLPQPSSTRTWARMHLDGKAGALWVCQQVDRLLSGFQFNDLMRLPLSRLYDIDCEWDGGWGRTVQQLTAFVRETCEDQVSEGSVDTWTARSNESG
jgi:hypothetical protein